MKSWSTQCFSGTDKRVMKTKSRKLHEKFLAKMFSGSVTTEKASGNFFTNTTPIETAENGTTKLKADKWRIMRYLQIIYPFDLFLGLCPRGFPRCAICEESRVTLR